MRNSIFKTFFVSLCFIFLGSNLGTQAFATPVPPTGQSTSKQPVATVPAVPPQPPQGQPAHPASQPAPTQPTGTVGTIITIRPARATPPNPVETMVADALIQGLTELRRAAPDDFRGSDHYHLSNLWSWLDSKKDVVARERRLNPVDYTNLANLLTGAIHRVAEQSFDRSLRNRAEALLDAWHNLFEQRPRMRESDFLREYSTRFWDSLRLLQDDYSILQRERGQRTNRQR